MRESVCMVRRSDEHEYKLKKVGLICALVCTFLFVGLTALALYLDHEWIASTFAFFSLGTVVVAFINGKDGAKKKDKENEEQL